MREWNPRFVNYARVHHRTPEQMLSHDEERFPGGKMIGFVLWNQSCLYRFASIVPDAFYLGNLIDHKSYDRWLDSLPQAEL